jgi:Mitochondrial K+-H+ exchange-related
LDNEAVYLVPIGSGRFDLYTEQEERDPLAPREAAGFWSRTIERLHEGWRQMARAATSRQGDRAGRLTRLRDWLVCRIAEAIAEQRTLWSLRTLASARFIYPSDLSETSAAAIRGRVLIRARRHHGWWLLINVGGVALTAVLVLLPGPNLIGYYFLFRVVAHYLSWRGARHALENISWRPIAEPALSELGALARVARDARAERVAAIASQLRLTRLEAFFDRVAVPAP